MRTHDGARYGFELRIKGHLDDTWTHWLGDLRVTHNDDGTSTITGIVIDQAQLYGLLDGLRNIGAQLVALQATGAESAAD